MKEITASRSFSIPVSMAQEIEEIIDKKGYYNKSEFARVAFQKEIEAFKQKNNGSNKSEEKK